MKVNPRRIGFNEECELKEAKIQMREVPVNSEIDELDAAQEYQLKHWERIAVMEKLLK